MLFEGFLRCFSVDIRYLTWPQKRQYVSHRFEAFQEMWWSKIISTNLPARWLRTASKISKVVSTKKTSPLPAPGCRFGNVWRADVANAKRKGRACLMIPARCIVFFLVVGRKCMQMHLLNITMEPHLCLCIFSTLLSPICTEAVSWTCYLNCLKKKEQLFLRWMVGTLSQKRSFG